MNDTLNAAIAFGMEAGYSLLNDNDYYVQNENDGEPFENWSDHVNFLQAQLVIVKQTNYAPNILDVIIRNDMFFDDDTCTANPYLAEAWALLSKTEQEQIKTIAEKTGCVYYDHTLDDE